MKKNISQNINIKRDWQILLFLLALGFIILSYFSWTVYLSSQVGNGYFKNPISTTETEAKVLDEKRLNADLLLLTGRQINKVKVVDPSL